LFNPETKAEALAMIEDSYVFIIAFLSFIVGLLFRGELSRLSKKKEKKEQS